MIENAGELRHRTAIVRGALSRPVRLATDLGLIGAETSVFDYGCGYGEDISVLAGAGLRVAGWDPHFRPDAAKNPADIVNLGYVINVIPNVTERHQVVRDAWQLSKRALLISARLENELRNLSRGRPHGDGFLTAHGTFQKFYAQGELRSWLDAVLELETVAVAPGVFVAFRSEKDASDFLLRTRRRRQVAVRVSRSDRDYEQHRDAIDSLIAFFGERGRLPAKGEVPLLERQLLEAVGSVKRAWRVATNVTPDTDWGAVSDERRQDLLVDIALLRLNRRPNFTRLPANTQQDVRTLVGSYQQAINESNQLLYRAGDMSIVSDAADQTSIGKRLPNALYVHESALNEIPHVLRVYEGCARWLVGEVDGANLVKLATDKPKVSYLEYPNFESDPHPSLKRTTFVRIGALNVDERHYGDSENPPVLHRKDTFISPDHPNYPKYKRLTEQEERFGLYDDVRSIGNRLGWENRLASLNLTLKGHRVVRRRP